MKIAEIRNLIGFSQTRFSEEYGIPLRTLQNWEGDVRTPSDYVLDLIEYKVRHEHSVVLCENSYDIAKRAAFKLDTSIDDYVASLVLDKRIIYDYDEREVLENVTHLVPEEITQELKNHTFTIYTVNDYIENLKNSDVLDDELESLGLSETAYINQLKSGKCFNDIDNGTWNGADYVIQYDL